MAYKDLVERQHRWNKMSSIEKLADRLASGWKPKKAIVCIAHGEDGEVIEAAFNDFVLKRDGTLELWHNDGYEI